MKKSKYISLVLITSLLASCDKQQPTGGAEGSYGENDRKVYMRSDTTAQYQRTHHGGSHAWLWFYAFRPYGLFNNGFYQRAGYYSGGLGNRANVGMNPTKAGIMRGGFGRTGVRASS